jgi:subfamily B ATP-binding cassette protein HlyB/CyaB
VQRLYAAESGRILIDGVDLAVVDVAWLRRQIGDGWPTGPAPLPS